MINYVYECENCKEKMSVYQSIKDQPLTQCSNCSQPMLKRLISAATVLFPSDPKTVGSLAERNRSKMGRYEREKADFVNEQKKIEAKKRAFEHTRLNAAKHGKMANDIPTTLPEGGDLDKKILQMNQEQIKDYVVEGKTL